MEVLRPATSEQTPAHQPHAHTGMRKKTSFWMQRKLHKLRDPDRGTADKCADGLKLGAAALGCSLLVGPGWQVLHRAFSEPTTSGNGGGRKVWGFKDVNHSYKDSLTRQTTSLTKQTQSQSDEGNGSQPALDEPKTASSESFDSALEEVAEALYQRRGELLAEVIEAEDDQVLERFTKVVKRELKGHSLLVLASTAELRELFFCDENFKLVLVNQKELSTAHLVWIAEDYARHKDAYEEEFQRAYSAKEATDARVIKWRLKCERRSPYELWRDGVAEKAFAAIGFSVEHPTLTALSSRSRTRLERKEEDGGFTIHHHGFGGGASRQARYGFNDDTPRKTRYQRALEKDDDACKI